MRLSIKEKHLVTCFPPYSDIAIRHYARADRGLGYGVWVDVYFFLFDIHIL